MRAKATKRAASSKLDAMPSEIRTAPDALPSITVMDGKASGAVRISLGIASNFDDAARFVAFARTLLDRPAVPWEN